MARRGRFGKYGDFKRKSLLRTQRSLPLRDAKVRMAKGHRPLPKAQYRAISPQFSIREASPSEITFIRTLSLKAFQQYGPYEESILAWHASSSTITLVAFKGNEPLGFAMIGPSLEGDSGVYELLAIAVVERWQRRSVGTLLMKLMENKAKNIGARKVILHTAKDNLAARQLFRKMGFREIGVKPGFYPAGQDAVMFVKEL